MRTGVVSGKKRRLLVVSHGYPPFYGGAEHAAGLLAKAAQRTGLWEVEVLTSDIGGRLPEREIVDDILIRRVPTRKKAWRYHSVPELTSFMLSAIDFQPEQRPDLILANFTLPGGEVARRIAARTGAPYVVVLHGSDVPNYQNERFGPIYPFARPWMRYVWRKAAAVVAVSDTLRDLALQSWIDGGIEVIPNGVDTELFCPLTQRPDIQRPIKILVHAQLIERKGIHHLLNAVARLQPEDRAALCVDVCGSGPQEGVLRGLVRDHGLESHVRFHGLVDYQHIPDRLRQGDVFVLPSRQEGMPLALLEAMACGLPAVVTPVGAMPQLVKEGISGHLVKFGDEAGLSEALMSFIREPSRCRVMGAAARLAAEQWSWREVWGRYEALIKSRGPKTLFAGR